MDGWISVKDRLPKDFQKVLVWRKNIGYDISLRKNGSWAFDNFFQGREVIAWMPLPKPPQMEGE